VRARTSLKPSVLCSREIDLADLSFLRSYFKYLTTRHRQFTLLITCELGTSLTRHALHSPFHHISIPRFPMQKHTRGQPPRAHLWIRRPPRSLLREQVREDLDATPLPASAFRRSSSSPRQGSRQKWPLPAASSTRTVAPCIYTHSCRRRRQLAHTGGSFSHLWLLGILWRKIGRWVWSLICGSTSENTYCLSLAISRIEEIRLGERRWCGRR
jgi:hypothetical protein